MNYFVITAVGEDKPGIVAKVTKILYENGFNIEDSTMTRLNNEFCIMLVVKGEKGEKEIEDSFSSIKDKDLSIWIKQIPEDVINKRKEVASLYNIIVFGADKPGIVFNVSKILADHNVNISDLRTEKNNDLYLMFIQAEVPPSTNQEDLENAIKNVSKDMNIDISVEKVEEAAEL